jgi:hypothetical protein
MKHKERTNRLFRASLDGGQILPPHKFGASLFIWSLFGLLPNLWHAVVTQQASISFFMPKLAKVVAAILLAELSAWLHLWFGKVWTSSKQALSDLSYALSPLANLANQQQAPSRRCAPGGNMKRLTLELS